MLRAESFTYSSVPQDEGTTPGSAFTTSRSPHNPHTSRDCQLTAIITTIVIVTGLTLAATLPLIIKSSTKSSSGGPDRLSNEEEEDSFMSSHFNGENSKEVSVKFPNFNYVSFEDYDFGSSRTTKPSVYVPVKTTKGSIIPEPNVTDKSPAIPIGVAQSTAPWNLSKTTVGSPVPTVGTVITTTPVRAPVYPTEGPVLSAGGSPQETSIGQGGLKPEIHLTSHKPVTESVKPVHSFIGDGSVPSNGQTEVSNEKKENIDLEQLLNEIYGEEGSAKPSSLDNGSWMSDVISSKDKLTLVILAAVVTVALAAVVAAVVWLIHSRITARRRRINIQNVITDLQSRDKIVLLNSEESDEE